MSKKKIIGMLKDVKEDLQLALSEFDGMNLESSVDDPVEFEETINLSISKLDNAIDSVAKSGALTPENIVEVEDAVHNAQSDIQFVIDKVLWQTDGDSKVQTEAVEYYIDNTIYAIEDKLLDLADTLCVSRDFFRAAMEKHDEILENERDDVWLEFKSSPNGHPTWYDAHIGDDQLVIYRAELDRAALAVDFGDDDERRRVFESGADYFAFVLEKAAATDLTPYADTVKTGGRLEKTISFPADIMEHITPVHEGAYLEMINEHRVAVLPSQFGVSPAQMLNAALERAHIEKSPHADMYRKILMDISPRKADTQNTIVNLGDSEAFIESLSVSLERRRDSAMGVTMKM